MRRKEKLPELLCPAGDMSALKAAIEGGADAVKKLRDAPEYLLSLG